MCFGGTKRDVRAGLSSSSFEQLEVVISYSVPAGNRLCVQWRTRRSPMHATTELAAIALARPTPPLRNPRHPDSVLYAQALVRVVAVVARGEHLL
jgi:hypothetical protein